MHNRAARETRPQREAATEQDTERSVYGIPVFAPRIGAEDQAGWSSIAGVPEQRQQEEIERLRGLVLEVLDYWNSGNWRILYVENMRGWRKRALDTLGPVPQEEAARAASRSLCGSLSAALAVGVPIPELRF